MKATGAIRCPLQLRHKLRDLALFNLAIDSKLRACDLIALRVTDIALAGQINSRAIVMQRKTHQPVQFEITELTRASLQTWIQHASPGAGACLFHSRVPTSEERSVGKEYVRQCKYRGSP